MKLGMTITIADMKNLLKEGSCRVSCLDFRILKTLGENNSNSGSVSGLPSGLPYYLYPLFVFLLIELPRFPFWLFHHLINIKYSVYYKHSFCGQQKNLKVLLITTSGHGVPYSTKCY